MNLLYALPPAESRLPMKSVFHGFSSAQPDFAGKLAEFLGADACVLANSARTLLYFILMDLKNKARSEQNQVLIPGYTCYSVAAATVRAGLKVALYDLDPLNFQPDMADVQRKISGRTLAIVGQHLLGVPSDIQGLTGLARDHGIHCIEDAAQSLDLFGSGSKLKMHAHFTLLSFGRGKPLPLGQGGALISGNGADHAWIVRAIKALPCKNGSSFIPFAMQIFSRPCFYWSLEKLPLGLGRTVYDPFFTVMAMSRAYQRMGEYALDELGLLNRHRSNLGKIYCQSFTKQDEGNYARETTAHVRYPVLVGQQYRVGELAHYGVRRLYPQALCDLTALKPELAESAVQTPGARKISRQLITFPTHLGVSDRLARKISDKAAKIFGDISIVKY